MLSRVNTVAFNGSEILDVDLQVQISSGLPAFTIVGLPDKAVAESRERVRAALQSLGLSLPAKRITLNLAPADLLKEGSHFDLPVALGLLAAVKANRSGKGLICPAANGSEAAWSGLQSIVAPDNLLSLVNHFKGAQLIPLPTVQKTESQTLFPDMSDVKEIAAAGAHNLLMIGPPGAGKSMLAARLPSILPPLTAAEALETSMIHSVAGELKNGGICFERPFRDPHHSASTPALVGGGRKARPGEISLAHNGVLFLDELPEFSRAALEALRQPLENGSVSISRVNAHTVYPARFQLIAAMNPCRCGNLGNPALACSRAPKCAEEYQSRISGPLLDRIDIHIEVPAVSPWEMNDVKKGESSAAIRERVIKAREIQAERFRRMGHPELNTNSQLRGDMLEAAAALDGDASALLIGFAEKAGLSARAYHRTLRLARTIADLQNTPKVLKMHIAEALALRSRLPGRQV